MRVLIDTTYALRAPLSGTAVYLERLIAGLAELPGLTVIPAANHRRRPPAGGGPGSAANALADARWIQVDLPQRARRAGADVIHHALPAHAYGAGIGQVVTVHDLAFEAEPAAFPAAYRRHARLTHRAAARRAGAVVCVSAATAGDVHTRWGVPRNRIIVAPHGPGQPLPAAARAQPPRHFLYVGDDQPRKDLPTLLEAHRRYAAPTHDRPPLPLVLAGTIGPGGSAALGAAVEVIQSPSAGRLAELHAAAAALVHPSRHEGFGLTLVEAMTAGTPVIAADTPAAREVCGDAAILVPAGDVDGLAAELSALAAQPGLRHDLTRRGHARAAAFSWRTSALAHLQAYSLASR